jgi:hypothetical protein
MQPLRRNDRNGLSGSRTYDRRRMDRREKSRVPAKGHRVSGLQRMQRNRLQGYPEKGSHSPDTLYSRRSRHYRRSDDHIEEKKNREKVAVSLGHKTVQASERFRRPDALIKIYMSRLPIQAHLPDAPVFICF